MPGGYKQHLQVPAGHSLFFAGHAIGTQNFICLSTKNKQDAEWRFTGPQATLFITDGDGLAQQATTHFLSANPGESGLPRPTWQDSADTSTVWGRVVASSAEPRSRAGSDPLVAVTGGRCPARAGGRRRDGADDVHSAVEHDGRPGAGDRVQRSGRPRPRRPRAVHRRSTRLARRRRPGRIVARPGDRPGGTIAQS